MAALPSPNPYEAPKDSSKRDGYRPLGWMTHGAAVGMFASVVCGLVLGVGGMAAEPGPAVEVTAVQVVVGLVALLSLAVSLYTSVVFLVWSYRAAKNVLAFGQYALTHSPGWGVGSWFLPIVSLWVPYQALKETFLASDPETVGTNDTSWVSRPVPALLPIWWGTYLIHSFLGMVAGIGPLLGRTHAERASVGGGVGGLIACFFSAIAAVAIVSVMKRLARRQELCAHKLGL